MKKRGFTLIELLAVIVILAVIALIAVPMILNVVEDARISAFKDSVYSAFNAVEYYVIDKGLGDVPESGIEVEFLNLKNNNFESGRMVKNVDGVLVAEFVSDGKYCATGSLTNLNISKGECEINAPGVESVVTGKEIAITITDDNGIVAYAITTSSEEPSEWTEVIETTRIEENITAEAAGTYYVHVRNKYGKTTTKQYVVEQNAFCAYQPGDVVGTFDYSGNVEEFIVPCDGTYKLEVWGSKGGSSSTGVFSKGGYSYGNKNLIKGTKLYVVCGGIPYNGGGIASQGYSGSSNGGGATHIAVGETNRGELKNYEQYKEEILIVAGGAGGSVRQTYLGSDFIGGTGGGATGGTNSNNLCTGGTQISGGTGGNTGSFGQGANGSNSCGGGGGWYGGAGAPHYYGGGGGSGYIGGVTDGDMSNGINLETGKAQITLVSIN